MDYGNAAQARNLLDEKEKKLSVVSAIDDDERKI
jgi:hypothetical protein